MIRVYVASPSENGTRAQLVAEHLARILPEAKVVSTWHSNGPVVKYPHDAAKRSEQLGINLADLARATVFVCLTNCAAEPKTTFAELGYAIARGLPVVWVTDGLDGSMCLFDAHELVWVINPGEGDSEKIAIAVVCVILDEIGTAAA